jgi:60 kDa SS-A/Ro ribonucleoprotein
MHPHPLGIHLSASILNRYLQQEKNPMTTTLAQPVTGSALNWMRFERFLLLGSQDGSWSAARQTLEPEQASAARACLVEDGPRVVETIVRFAATRNAPGRQPALLALAIAASPAYASARTNAAALAALPEVAVTGAQLLHFVRFAETQRGWGRGLRSAVADWYVRKPAAELARHFAVRSHRDLLRNAHPKPANAAQNALFQWAVEGRLGHLATPELLSGELRLIHAVEQVRAAASEDDVVRVIEDYRLPHHLVPAEWKTSARVWEALLHSLPYRAMVKHLGQLIAPQSASTALLVARLIDRRRIFESRIHPVALLLASKTYQRSNNAVQCVVDALEEALHIASANVEPLSLAVTCYDTAECSLAAAGLALMSGASGPVDASVVITGSGVKPRLRSGSEPQITIAVNARRCHTANPDDPLELAIAGFDARVPGLITEFLVGQPLLAAAGLLAGS